MSALIIHPRGVCAREIVVSTSNGIIEQAHIDGCCPGLSRAVCSLITGMQVVDAVQKLKGIQCGNRGTSCPNELAKALEEA